MKILAVFIMAILSLGSSSKVNTSGNNSTPGSSFSKDDGTKYIFNFHGSCSKEEISEFVKTMAKMEETIKKMAQNITNMQTKIDNLHPANAVGKDCADLYKKGYKLDGVYTVNPDGQGDFKVYCDQTTSGGGWLIFQRRFDGSVDFYRRGWNDYKNGFGNITGEYWLGLDKINRLTRQGSLRLRVDLQDMLSNAAYAEYENFSVASEKTNYKLVVGKYKGTAGDSLSYHNNRPFSTRDRDNDAHRLNCAQIYYGAWWFNACHHSDLNGLYLHGKHRSYFNGVNWMTWKGYYYSAKRAEMKIRPMNY